MKSIFKILLLEVFMLPLLGIIFYPIWNKGFVPITGLPTLTLFQVMVFGYAVFFIYNVIIRSSGVLFYLIFRDKAVQVAEAIGLKRKE
jgi:hypothetical protein